MVALVPLAPLAGKAALALAGGEIVKQVTRSVLNGASFQAGAELVYQIANWARSIDADWDSQGMEPGDGGGRCWEVDGSATCFIDLGDPPGATILGWDTSVKKILKTEPGRLTPESPLGSTSVATLELVTGEIVTANSGAWNYDAAIWWLDPIPPSVCSGNSPGGTADPLVLPPIQSGDCTINVTLEGFLANPDGTGNVQPVWLMEPAQELRASGGVIVGECNFQPTVVVGGGGDGDEPPTSIPSPPDKTPGSNPWWDAVAKGIVSGLTEELLEQLLNKTYPEMVYRMVSVCEKDESGEPISEAVEVPIPALRAPDAQLARLDAIAELLQASKNFKQPVCGNENPEPEGAFRTISFRSESTSPYGNSRLRKRFRYRSLSSIGLGELVDYWRDFSWQSGPVRVRHIGASWGAPEVWAASESEGQRVIRHAAGEAGINPDQVGRWSTRRSNSSRLGVSDKMNVDTTGGYFWITARDGSNERPVVAAPADY